MSKDYTCKCGKKFEVSKTESGLLWFSGCKSCGRRGPVMDSEGTAYDSFKEDFGPNYYQMFFELINKNKLTISTTLDVEVFVVYKPSDGEECYAEEGLVLGTPEAYEWLKGVVANA